MEIYSLLCSNIIDEVKKSKLKKRCLGEDLAELLIV